jgi:ribosomal protein S18 acetylase RimI-like enzyme
LTELRGPELLDPKRHDRSTFDSGEQSLDEWLRRYAGQNRCQNTAATWVIADRADVVAAYASLSMTSIDRSSAPATVARQAPDPIPALLLGRLAVDARYAGLGVGTSLVAHVFTAAMELNLSAACRAVVVTAINERAQAWWERFGFQRLDPPNAASLDLYLLTADIEATLRSWAHDL